MRTGRFKGLVGIAYPSYAYTRVYIDSINDNVSRTCVTKTQAANNLETTSRTHSA